MIAKILAKIIGTNNARQLRRLQPIVAEINAYEPRIKELSDEALRAKTTEFKEQLAHGKKLDALLPEAFAVVREAAFRTLKQRHYDVQLIGGIVLHQGKIAEMKTGEGKTLTATLPLYLNALTGKGAHLVTVNDYLARRDAEWMKPVYEALGLTVGVIQNSLNDHERKAAYACDIIYVTNNELGFDYLRDNMKFRLSDYVQRELSYAIVDEVDSILIDEARTPLIISGATDESSKLYGDVDKVIRHFKKDVDYEIDEKARTAQFTEMGNDKLEAAFNIQNMYAIENIKLLHHCNQALKAHALFKRDVDYIVRDDEVLIVDEFTGRILAGRRYSDGLHQALEAKEAVPVERESQTLASITLQNYFRLYTKLAGMTGTASTEAEEFHKIYKLDVVTIPTNQPMIRLDKQDLIFLTKKAKYDAIAQDVQNRFKSKQPVLIGTVAIETSEHISAILQAHGIPHDVLNAKQHAREADIVAHAGEPGRVTIATNMAGRGTDIKLTPESVEAGGLYILGTERHESRRIDNQLRGRAGRQGDPGESRFYISLEDDLIRRFAGDSIKKNMERVGMTADEVIESRFISKTIESSQERVEKYNFEIRKHLIEYDDVLNQQRIVIYSFRRSVLEGEEEIIGIIKDLIAQSVEIIVGLNSPSRSVDKETRDRIIHAIAHMTNMPVKDFDVQGVTAQVTQEALTTGLIQFLIERYTALVEKHQSESAQQAQKWLMLESIDQAWKQHMLNLNHLKEGIDLRGWGQKNPLIEYKREAFAMFEDMMRSIRLEIVHHIFHINFEQFDAQAIEQKREHELDQLQIHNIEAAIDQVPSGAPQKARDHVGRNDDCPCGSGKKFKKCHGK